MQQALDYKIIITNEGVLVFLIKSRVNTPQRPFLLYDGGRHATLYRSQDETIALDYIDEKVIDLLDDAEKVLIFEMDDEIEDVLRTYEAPVKHIKRNAFVESL